MKFKVIENDKEKWVVSSLYNYFFDKKTGYFARWGKTKDDDPIFAPSPEILDLEISSGGGCLGNCDFCYKDNGGNQPVHNLSFEDFKNIFHKINKNHTLTQIAFGIMNISSNPDFFKMMEYSRENRVIPNYTCHGLDVIKEIAEKTAKVAGAVAVSVYNKEKSSDAIKMFTDAGMTQVNIHYFLARESYDRAFEIIDDIITDPRLEKLNAIVFLQLKKKGRGGSFNYINSVDDYKKLINYCKEKKIGFGFDSCSGPLYLKSMEGTKEYQEAITVCEPCESSHFSSYINDHGVFFPCSFSEEVEGWEEGLNVLTCDDFIKDIWMNQKVLKFRKNLISSSQDCDCISKKYCRSCPIYKETAGCKHA